MKKSIGLILALSICACSKHSNGPTANPETITNPIAPICGTVSWAKEGTIRGNTIPHSITVIIPNYDATNGDTADFSYKRDTSAIWIPFRLGFSSLVTFTIAGSTVTITNLDDNGFGQGILNDWAIAATIHECH